MVTANDELISMLQPQDNQHLILFNLWGSCFLLFVSLGTHSVFAGFVHGIKVKVKYTTWGKISKQEVPVTNLRSYFSFCYEIILLCLNTSLGLYI